MNPNGLPEILAPAGGAASLTAALRCGADAVYLGTRQFSARNHAENFDTEGLRAAAELCHLYGAKLYLAVNTLIFPQEFSALDALLETAAEIGADGAIVQDLGAAAYMRKRLPTLPLHASTQMTIHSPAGVQFAAQAGFCRVVLARELSREQMRACVDAAKCCGIETEVFVHGAHCMCVSGQCWLSAAMGGRSANRGVCAQPCRLPFSASDSGKEAYALSLKDQSLLKHLHEICEMGVDSMKIEGRMKRPEYVAAAVTACRAALQGTQPDLGGLRAVFSRSGFTDGYFTGMRREMFGIRQKEDVLAAQTVLQEQEALYRKPRKVAALDICCTLRHDEPAKLSASDGQIAVQIAGACPQPAQNRPTDADMLRRQFEKLGDTIYSAGSISAEIDDGVMLPAASLNAMRREAVAALNRARIAANTPKHYLGEIPAYPVCGKCLRARVFRMQIRNADQLSMLENDLLPEKLLLPLHLLPDYLKSRSSAWFSQENVLIVPPRFVCNEDDIRRRLQAAREMGFSRLACSTVGDLWLGHTLGFVLHGTLGLHVTSTAASTYLRDFGVRDALLSPESAQQPKPAGVLPLGVLAYGRLPLMLTRNCPIQHQVGCARCRHTLTDRRHASFYTDCTRCTDKPDYAELFNPAVVWLADRPEQYESAAYALLFMTDETPERVREVAAAYIRGEKTAPPAKFTRGLRLDDARRDDA